MTTYYGVWSDWSGRDGQEWWYVKDELFYTSRMGIAKAQAMVSNAIWKAGPAFGTRKDEHWEACAIGEDGLPMGVADFAHKPESHECGVCGDKATHRGVSPEAQPLYYCPEHARAMQIRSEAAVHKCELCDKVATNWIELPRPYQAVYFCDRHEVWGRLFLGTSLLAERREL